jgi:hypothetical protein
MASPFQCADAQQVAVTPAWCGWENFLALSWQRAKADDYGTTAPNALHKSTALSIL